MHLHPPSKRYQLQVLLALGAALLMLTACGGDDEGSSSDEVTEAAPGCYDPESHMCDCDTDEASCEDAEGVWTDECACD